MAAAPELTDRELFLFDLCREIGCPHPDFLTNMLSTRQIDSWIAYNARRPFGDVRADMRMARITCAIYQTNSKRKLRKKDYMLSFKKPLSPDSYKRKAMNAYEAHNARHKE